DGGHLLQRELGRVHRVSEREHPSGGHELDDVGAVFGLPAYGVAALIGPGADSLADARRDDAVGGKRIDVRMAAPRTDWVERYQHAGTDDESVADGVAQAEIDVLGRSQIAHGGEPGFEHAPRIGGSEMGLLGSGTLKKLDLVLVPARPRLEGQVLMGVHEPRKERRISEIDRLGSSRGA